MTDADLIRKAQKRLGPQATEILRRYRQSHHNSDGQPDEKLLAEATEIIVRHPDDADIILKSPM